MRNHLPRKWARAFEREHVLDLARVCKLSYYLKSIAVDKVSYNPGAKYRETIYYNETSLSVAFSLKPYITICPGKTRSRVYACVQERRDVCKFYLRASNAITATMPFEAV